MTKHIFMSLLMVVAVAGSIQAQGLLPRRTLEGSRIQRQMGSAELLASTTNAAERAQIRKPLTKKDIDAQIAENRLWNSWPRRSSDRFSGCPDDIRAQAERKFNCVFVSIPNSWSTNSWRVGQGTSCIIAQYTDYGWDLLQKIDASGKIVGISRSDAVDYDIFEELKWIDDQMSKRIDELQEKWAKEHNMTVDEAKAKYAKWKEEHHGTSLRARRLQLQQESKPQVK